MAAAWTGPCPMFIRDRVWGLQPVVEPVAGRGLAGVYSGSESSLESESSVSEGLISAVGPGSDSYAISGGFEDRVLTKGLNLSGRTQ